ncbi:hypothetical protein [Serpentinicella alkaliphila]|uniref:Catalytic LigB subunit of aromatic ring-opening dioxygenase n=1 Tax=Serpentinicella alkaliphila TaxID=1734049 RepID=A0A4R2TVR8_9FIRM|nr:hypothetical protein HZR23_05325 [Serpentinicella alkaliphila]TCQ07052.1 catalytic LigB subunit of aromatic ring-opening dioxygenase [Serpentinicella alkaliphila]
MSIQGFYLLPHPPIIVPEVGKGAEEKIKNTRESLNDIAADISMKGPSTIILITPHGPMFQDAIALASEDEINGDLKNFGAPEVKMTIQLSRELTKKII